MLLRIPFLFCVFAVAVLNAMQKPNVLFIAVDDLKPSLSNYGDSIAISPNFERLAAQGMTFVNAHCQQAVCGPSRASVMTGLRPDQTRVWDLQTKIRKENPDVVTIPQHFKANGYTSVGVGKLFDFRSVQGHSKDDPASWSRPYVVFDKNPNSEFGLVNKDYVAQVRATKREIRNSGKKITAKKVMGGSPAYEGTEAVDDEAYDDGQIAKSAVALLQELAPREEPFFLAVGFKKPHLPFVAPKQYWDLYSEDQFKVDPQTVRPQGAPEYHHQPGWELRNGSYSGMPLLQEMGGIPDATALKLIHGYYACVSYIDAQLGKVLDALEASGEADNTIIVLWGDHGFHLGDHGMWCKHTNYEQSTRVPFMVVDPLNEKAVRGVTSNSPVELVDIFATLCDVSGLEEPVGIEGTSLVRTLENPKKQLKPVATSQFPRHLDGREIMGYTWRSDDLRYIEWIDTRFREGGSSGKVLDVELYDYKKDPKETRNVATDPVYAEELVYMQRQARIYKSVHGINVDQAPEWLSVADTSELAMPIGSIRGREPDELITYASRPEGELVFHVFKPKGWEASDQRAAMVAIHGGGWNSGSPKAFYPQAQHLSDLGMVVICPQYRIKNVHKTTPFESTHDAVQAMQYVRAHAAELGIDPNRIAAAGGSAGGHLAASTATVPGFESKEATLLGASPHPNALVLFNPVLDTGPRGYGYGALREEWQAISPLVQLKGAQPPMLIFNGDRDTTTSAERAMAFAEKMNQLGNRCELVIYPDQFHSFFHRGHPRQFADTLARTVEFLDELGYLERSN